jgi:hypothetical protein
VEVELLATSSPVFFCHGRRDSNISFAAGEETASFLCVRWKKGVVESLIAVGFWRLSDAGVVSGVLELLVP